ncbi:unnamed protein product, partial [Brachionus calyciflorus]
MKSFSSQWRPPRRHTRGAGPDHINISLHETIYPNLKLNLVTNRIVDFLDLNVSFDFDYKIIFNLFVKPTNTQNYLNNNSNHPRKIFKNIPNGLIYRIRRICSNLNDYYFHTSKVHNALIKCGYSSTNIKHLIRTYA